MNLNAPNLSDQLDPDLLPDSLNQLSDIMGLNAALSLVRTMPGVRVYVPANMTESNAIAQIVGMEAAQKLSKHFAGDRIQLPSIKLQLQDIQLYQLKADGFSNKDCALKMGVTERTIERRLAHHREGGFSSQELALNRDERQLDLWSEHARSEF